jgi:acetyl esterase/lipase
MSSPIDRRRFLASLAVASSAGAIATRLGAAEESVRKSTHVYKRVGNCEIKADVYEPTSGEIRPVVLWIHGGALIMGDRGGIPRILREKLLKAGFVIVSIDYRLAPETKLPAILEDIRDAHRWMREKGPDVFKISADRMAVMGGSAGGYLTLVSGYLFEPRPRALVSFWGYGDIAGDWYSRPDPFYSRQPLVAEDEARAAVGTQVLAEPQPKNNRGRFYLYCRQKGIWPKEVASLDPDTQAKAFDPYCPVRNVTAAYPPTLLIHGTKDTDVPYAQSELMAKELERRHVEHELLTIPDGGHGLGNVDPTIVERTYERAVEFAVKRTK